MRTVTIIYDTNETTLFDNEGAQARVVDSGLGMVTLHTMNVGDDSFNIEEIHNDDALTAAYDFMRMYP